ncbi:MAG: sigma-54-dependent Fis family transcriptional regulator [Ignavibacteria bacterium GWA2_35_9]|nr:MAG: sigma-54-dependent Fis family transcriptional regulator [Ignavibacteria bacterium GWA2_35_9]OGU53404.1 MAG: sigma-54-dependent Fis family transcriptional regulator [Ignavibacteria bacterium GWC2_36_12]
MTKKNTKVLIVDDNEDILVAAKLLLKPYASVIETEKNPNQLPELLSKNSYDVIFLDMNFTQDMTSGKEGFYWLNQILKIDPTIIVIMITAYGDIEMAVKAVKEGATDFILKPWQNEKLLATFSAAIKLRESKLEINNLRSQQKYLSDDLDKKFQELIGLSDPIQEVFRTIEKVAKTDANILILGENGTGKELVARALHRQSARSEKVFINVDMGALTPTLFESELFGHVKGAFTDAKDDRVGRFEAASGGTLFLDEIGNIPLELQAKLLTVIQNRNVARVGSNTYHSIDIRLICATNHSIYDMVKEGKFRQDLLYRINTVEIRIPPLRERKEDIQLLAEYFLEIFKKKYNKPDLFLPVLTMKRLENYHWPGNVRELQHAIERSAIMSEANELQPSDFFFTTASNKDETFVLSNYNLENVEKQVIIKVLREHNGNITQAAKELGLTRTSLYRRMEKYGL